MMKSFTNVLFVWKQFYQLRMSKKQSAQEHLGNFKRILTDLLNVGEKVEKKTGSPVLLSSLHPESLMTALVGKSIIKIKNVTAALL